MAVGTAGIGSHKVTFTVSLLRNILLRKESFFRASPERDSSWVVLSGQEIQSPVASDIDKAGVNANATPLVVGDDGVAGVGGIEILARELGLLLRASVQVDLHIVLQLARRELTQDEVGQPVTVPVIDGRIAESVLACAYLKFVAVDALWLRQDRSSGYRCHHERLQLREVGGAPDIIGRVFRGILSSDGQTEHQHKWQQKSEAE